MVFYLLPGFQQGNVRFIRNLDASFCQQCCDRMIVTITFHIKGGSQRFYLQIIAADDKTFIFVFRHFEIGFSVQINFPVGFVVLRIIRKVSGRI